MPDLDNMAKRVQGRWKSFGVRAALGDAASPAAPAKLGQALAYVLAQCAASYAGVQLLPAIHAQLLLLSPIPVAQRYAAFLEMQFPRVGDEKGCALKAARRVGVLLCEGKLQATEVAAALSAQFLHNIVNSEFFGRLTSEDAAKIYSSAELAQASLGKARVEIQSFVDGTAGEFAESLFTRMPKVEKPDLARPTTAVQMEHRLVINDALLADLEDPS